MITHADDLLNQSIRGTDGNVGSLYDLYVADDSWQVRYLVVDTGPWLFGQRVLLSPQALRTAVEDAANACDVHLSVDLSKEQIESSPNVSLEQPISRQQEAELFNHYGWVNYWDAAPFTLPTVPIPYTPSGPLEVETDETQADLSASADDTTADNAPRAGAAIQRESLTIVENEGSESSNKEQSDLRSMRELIGYRIHTSDDEIGHIEDLLLDVESWHLRYLLVDTRNWLPGRKVLIAVDAIESVNWLESTVNVYLNRAQVEQSPEYEGRSSFSRELEIQLYRIYDIPGYWI